MQQFFAAQKSGSTKKMTINPEASVLHAEQSTAHLSSASA
jgi:hypothetical protein